MGNFLYVNSEKYKVHPGDEVVGDKSSVNYSVSSTTFKSRNTSVSSLTFASYPTISSTGAIYTLNVNALTSAFEPPQSFVEVSSGENKNDDGNDFFHEQTSPGLKSLSMKIERLRLSRFLTSSKDSGQHIRKSWNNKQSRLSIRSSQDSFGNYSIKSTASSAKISFATSKASTCIKLSHQPNLSSSNCFSVGICKSSRLDVLANMFPNKLPVTESRTYLPVVTSTFKYYPIESLSSRLLSHTLPYSIQAISNAGKAFEVNDPTPSFLPPELAAVISQEDWEHLILNPLVEIVNESNAKRQQLSEIYRSTYYYLPLRERLDWFLYGMLWKGCISDCFHRHFIFPSIFTASPDLVVCNLFTAAGISFFVIVPVFLVLLVLHILCFVGDVLTLRILGYPFVRHAVPSIDRLLTSYYDMMYYQRFFEVNGHLETSRIDEVLKSSIKTRVLKPVHKKYPHLHISFEQMTKSTDVDVGERFLITFFDFYHEQHDLTGASLV